MKSMYSAHYHIDQVKFFYERVGLNYEERSRLVEELRRRFEILEGYFVNAENFLDNVVAKIFLNSAKIKQLSGSSSWLISMMEDGMILDYAYAAYSEPDGSLAAIMSKVEINSLDFEAIDALSAIHVTAGKDAPNKRAKIREVITIGFVHDKTEGFHRLITQTALETENIPVVSKEAARDLFERAGLGGYIKLFETRPEFATAAAKLGEPGC